MLIIHHKSNHPKLGNATTEYVIDPLNCTDDEIKHYSGHLLKILRDAALGKPTPPNGMRYSTYDSATPPKPSKEETEQSVEQQSQPVSWRDYTGAHSPAGHGTGRG